MAFDKKPSTWLGAGYAVASSAAKFNTNTAGSNKLLTQIIDADADPTTGDIRILAMALCEMLFTSWQSIAVDNRPAKMTISKKSTTGSSSATIFTYNFQFTVSPTTITVASE